MYYIHQRSRDAENVGVGPYSVPELSKFFFARSGCGGLIGVLDIECSLWTSNAQDRIQGIFDTYFPMAVVSSVSSISG